MAVRPDRVRFERGADQIACMSLSPNGTLRWFAACCRTPLANTPRNWRFPHVGLVHDCLESQGDTSAVFGPVRMVVNRQRASRPVAAAPLPRFIAAIARYAVGLLTARVTGAYRRNPFFDDTGKPLAVPKVVSKEERERLRNGG
jgi:hypothetical protein